MMGLKVFTFAAMTNEQDYYILHENIIAQMDVANFNPSVFNIEPTNDTLEDIFMASSHEPMGEDSLTPYKHIKKEEDKVKENNKEREQDIMNPHHHITTEG